MKHYSNFVLNRTVLIGLFALGGLIFAVAFVNNSNETFAYKSFDSKISITSTNMDIDSKIEASNFVCEADFLVDGDQVLDISSFRFSVPIVQFKPDHQKVETAIQQLFKSSDGTSINFVQQRVMVLPTMKMIHLIGEISIANVKQHIAFQLAYDLNKNKELILKGKQFIRLSDFGIVIPQDLLGKIKNEFSINLNIKMIEEKLATSKTNY